MDCIYFRHRNFEYKITDIGGQISERRKWIQYFGKAEAILFVTSLADYDKMSINCRCRNQLTESMQLFKIVLTWFKKSSCVLFLNKKDLFKEKIMESHLGTDHLLEPLLKIRHKKPFHRDLHSYSHKQYWTQP